MTSTQLVERMEGAQVAQQQGDGKSLFDELEDPKFKEQVARALPAMIEPERFLRLALTAARGNKQLLRCSRASFLGAVMTAAQLGLEIDVRGLAYLTPRWNKNTQSNDAVLIIGYKGFIDLARASGVEVQAEVVYEGDEFEFAYGTDKYLYHVPKLTGDRGAVVAAYAIADGATSKFMVLRVEDIEKRRGRSSAKSGPWVTDWEAMARKSAVRALSAYLPQNVRLAAAAALDETVRTNIDAPLEDVKPVYDDVIDVDAIDDEENATQQGAGDDGSAGQASPPEGTSSGAAESEPAPESAGEAGNREDRSVSDAATSPAQTDGDPGETAGPSGGPEEQGEPPTPVAPSPGRPSLEEQLKGLDRKDLIAEARKWSVAINGSMDEIRARIVAKLEEPM